MSSVRLGPSSLKGRFEGECRVLQGGVQYAILFRKMLQKCIWNAPW